MAGAARSGAGAEPGIYQFKTNLEMAGRWALTLGAKVQGETGTVPSQADRQREMTPLSRRLATAAAIAVAAAAGYWGGRIVPSHTSFASRPARAHRPGHLLQGPNGRPFYSLSTAKTDDGEPYVAVLASEDVERRSKPGAAAAQAGKIIHYRNPMGLPTSLRCRRRIPWGWTTSPFYEGDQDDGNTVRVSAGRLQRSGVKTELVGTQPISQIIKAPGVVAFR
jgi:Cu(I)/Ag(I) efflux system membrane fusion protein